MQVQSNTNDAVEIKVFDLGGKLVQKFRGAVGESMHVGQNLTGGVYLVQVVQGQNHATLKVEKL